MVNYPLEQLFVQDLRERVYQLLDLSSVEVFCEDLASNSDRIACQGIHEDFLLDP